MLGLPKGPSIKTFTDDDCKEQDHTLEPASKHAPDKKEAFNPNLGLSYGAKSVRPGTSGAHVEVHLAIPCRFVRRRADAEWVPIEQPNVGHAENNMLTCFKLKASTNVYRYVYNVIASRQQLYGRLAWVLKTRLIKEPKQNIRNPRR
jgi:diadenosine tetraphosphate (Ap4A) HIT family hydrolase